MLVTSSQLLPYPEGEDFANGALDLQVLAEAINAKLTAQFADYASVLNRRVQILRLNTPQTGLVANTNTLINFDQVLYDSDGFPSPSLSFGPSNDPGVFMVGAYLFTNPTGTVNSGTVRRIIVSANVYLGPNPTDFRNFSFNQENFESVSGSEHQVAMGMVRAENPVFSIASIFFNHGNTGSTIVVGAGSLAWLYRVADLEV